MELGHWTSLPSPVHRPAQARSEAGAEVPVRATRRRCPAPSSAALRAKPKAKELAPFSPLVLVERSQCAKVANPGAIWSSGWGRG
jgi:hypothetical protein